VRLKSSRQNRLKSLAYEEGGNRAIVLSERLTSTITSIPKFFPRFQWLTERILSTLKAALTVSVKVIFGQRLSATTMASDLMISKD